MKTVHQVIQNNQLATPSGIRAKQDFCPKQKATSYPSQTIEKNRKRIDRLFLTFSAFYGQVWRSQFKSDEFLAFAKNEWVEALMGFEDREMDDAVLLCRNSKEYPPTLPQFVDLCKQLKKREAFNQPREEQPFSNPDVAHHHLQKIKQLLQRNPH